MSFDVAHVRTLYPALSDGYAWLDAAAGTQVPQTVIDAIVSAYRGGIGNSGGAFPASAHSDAIVAEARQAVADLVGGDADGVVLGPNMTTLTYRFAYALAKRWGPGDEIVVSASTTTPTSVPGCRRPNGRAPPSGGPRSRCPRASCPPGSTTT